MAAAMSLGKFFIGGSLFLIGINWVAEGNFPTKWRLLRARKSILVLILLFILHLIAVAWAADKANAWHDVKIKLPLLIIPLVIGTSDPLEKKFFEPLIFVFILSVFTSSLITILVAYGYVHPTNPVNDLRDCSLFVPLMRLALMVVFSIFLLVRWTVRMKNIFIRSGCLLFMLWFMWFLQRMQSLTGMVILALGGAILLLSMAFIYRRKKLAFVLLLIYLGASISGIWILRKAYNDLFAVVPVDVKKVDSLTAHGNPYTNKINYPMIENGNQVMMYVCWGELDSAWNRKSKIVLNGGTDKNGNSVSITLLRYLASKGLRKDADALATLSENEIHEIENGVTNAKDKERSPLEKRIYQVFWEYYHYMNGANPSGNSFTMRLELAQTAWSCIKDHPFAGTGTGSQEKAFGKKYSEEGTKLGKEWQWLHSHDQFLAIGVTLGIPGIIFFLFMLFYAPWSMKRWRSYLYLAFFLVFFLSMFDDDTLETEQGVNFFAFFNALLLYAMPRKSALNTEMKIMDEIKTEN